MTFLLFNNILAVFVKSSNSRPRERTAVFVYRAHGQSPLLGMKGENRGFPPSNPHRVMSISVDRELLRKENNFMLETNWLFELLADLGERLQALRGYL